MVMSEIKIFVDISESTTGKVVICQENANKLGIKNGASVEIENPDNSKKTVAVIEISNMVLDFAGQVSKNIVDALEFTGVELIIRPTSSKGLIVPKLQVPKVPVLKPVVPPPSTSKSELTPLPTRPPQLTPSRPTPQPTDAPIPQTPPPLEPQPVPGHIPIPAQQPTPTPPPQPVAGHIPIPAQQPTPTPPPQPVAGHIPIPAQQPAPTPLPQPTLAPSPQLTPTPTPIPQVPLPQIPQPIPSQAPLPTPGQEFDVTDTPVDPYSNRIDADILRSQKNGVVLTPNIDNSIEGGRVQLSSTVIQQLGLGQSMLIAWEDPLTRVMAGNDRSYRN
jgi:hypothetical protein